MFYKFKEMLAGLGILMVTGCEKKIDFSLKTSPSLVVVEATIENGEMPRVVLTRSFAYFSQISPEILSKGFIHGADVSIMDGPSSNPLREYAFQTPTGLALYFYAPDTSNPAPIKGQIKHSYRLVIKDQNQVYEATTSIPAFNKRIDSMWYKPVQGDTAKVMIVIKATDPVGYGDYIQYFTKRNNQAFLAPPTSAYDDQFIDGTTYSLDLETGVDRNAPKNKDGNYFYKGDTVTLKLSSIDKATYDFWRTMEYSYQSIGNPFSTPVTVLGNVNNGALGYFGGYASQYRTLIIPR
ncbi:MAG: hypothetical protein NVS9B7_29650 [Flavisolibacter sp.]